MKRDVYNDAADKPPPRTAMLNRKINSISYKMFLLTPDLKSKFDLSKEINS